MVMETEAFSSKRMVSFFILPNRLRLSLIRNNLIHTYPTRYPISTFWSQTQFSRIESLFTGS